MYFVALCLWSKRSLRLKCTTDNIAFIFVYFVCLSIYTMFIDWFVAFCILCINSA